MDHYTDQSSSNIPTHSDELQLAVLKQQNTRLTYEILPFKVKKLSTPRGVEYTLKYN